MMHIRPSFAVGSGGWMRAICFSFVCDDVSIIYIISYISEEMMFIELFYAEKCEEQHQAFMTQ